jgi:hypothetical protein
MLVQMWFFNLVANDSPMEVTTLFSDLVDSPKAIDRLEMLTVSVLPEYKLGGGLAGTDQCRSNHLL